MKTLEKELKNVPCWRFDKVVELYSEDVCENLIKLGNKVLGSEDEYYCSSCNLPLNN